MLMGIEGHVDADSHFAHLYRQKFSAQYAVSTSLVQTSACCKSSNLSLICANLSSVPTFTIFTCLIGVRFLLVLMKF